MSAEESADHPEIANLPVAEILRNRGQEQGGEARGSDAAGFGKFTQHHGRHRDHRSRTDTHHQHQRRQGQGHQPGDPTGGGQDIGGSFQ